MAEDKTLTPADAVNVLEKLLPAQDKSFILGLIFKLPHHEVKSIHSTYTEPQDRLLQVLIKFTYQTEPRPTWRVIVEALRSPAVGLQALADKIERDHCAKSTTSFMATDSAAKFTAESEVSQPSLATVQSCPMGDNPPPQVVIVNQVPLSADPQNGVHLHIASGTESHHKASGHKRQPSLGWREGKSIPIDRLHWASSVLINGNIYFGGNDLESDIVVRYNPANDDWSELPKPPVKAFSMTSLNNQLLIVGGDSATVNNVSSIMVWDSDHGKWVYYSHSMPTGRAQSAAVGYKEHLIIACGLPSKSEVDILDTLNGKWHKAQPVPQGGHCISSAVVNDHWYLSSGNWNNSQPHIYCAHLPTLIDSAKFDEHPSIASIWHELSRPDPQMVLPTILASPQHLLIAGGIKKKDFLQKIYHYDQKLLSWEPCAQLPEAMFGASCIVLPSGDMIVAGGKTKDVKEYKRLWIFEQFVTLFF